MKIIQIKLCRCIDGIDSRIKENYYITIISNPTDKCKDYVIWDTCENNTDWEENNEKTGF